jgi:hypothetical protein
MQRANQEYAAAVARASYVPPLTIPLHAQYLKKTAHTEALYAQINETLRGILSEDEFAAEAPR